MQDLRQVLGVDASLPENVAKELILQVISKVPIFFSWQFHYIFVNHISSTLFASIPGTPLDSNGVQAIKVRDFLIFISPVQEQTLKNW